MKTGRISRQLARQMRKNPTEAETILWSKLRQRQLFRFRFLRQHCIFYKFNSKKRFFIADFYCHALKIVIEVDGKVHEHQSEYDQARTEIILSKKLEVIRFTNQEILNNINDVIEKLKRKIEDMAGKK
jgi:very-short-patch-repair endonuclease